jgi:hypothetical protein
MHNLIKFSQLDKIKNNNYKNYVIINLINFINIILKYKKQISNILKKINKNIFLEFIKMEYNKI